jgi:thymidylate kinase
MPRMNGTFVQIDGIDGAGKSTASEAAVTWLRKRGLTVFDAIGFQKAHGRPPSLEEVSDAQALLTSEPTYSWTGAAIREEIVRTGTPYSARLTAEAYALDRAVQHIRLTRPFLNGRPDRWVIQERGLFSSLAYQTLQSVRNGEAEPVTESWLLSLDGNRVTLDRAPDLFIILDVPPDAANTRVKRDDHRFEGIAFQTALAERYRDPAVREPLERLGTRFVSINASRTQEAVAADIRALLEQLAA